VAEISATILIIKGTKMSNAETTTLRKIRQNVKEPPKFRVIYINDNTTTLEFVVESLIEFFDYNPTTATEIAQCINDTGAATVAVLPYEIAEQKGVEVTLSARSQNYPLQIKLEPDID
jgi:ATP-dependent Clp protease adaptor protein ClpS